MSLRTIKTCFLVPCAAAALTLSACGSDSSDGGDESTAGTSSAGTTSTSGGSTSNPEGQGGTSSTSTSTKGGSTSTSSGGSSSAGTPTTEKFSFFVISYKAIIALSGSTNGFGGDLRYGETGSGAGLRGADKNLHGSRRTKHAEQRQAVASLPERHR
ncbi:MAG: hypothetical protein QM784_34595 [Polyangiaceae bacterium]